MKKLITSLFAALAVIAASVTLVVAANSDYIGSYYTLNSDAPGYAAVDIISCDDNSISLKFKRIKNDTETYSYTFSNGTISGDKASVPFHAVINASGAEFDGTMSVTFYNGMIKVKLTSSLGTELYSGTLPKVSLSHFDNNTTNPTPNVSSVSTDVSVVLNGQKLSFAENGNPRIIDGSTYVPLRSVFSNMGINVYWDEYQKNDTFMEQLITCTKNNTIVQFSRTFNNSGYNVWTLHKWSDLDTNSDNYTNIDITTLQPLLIGELSYVPLRVISESFGALVDWNDNSRMVIIDCDTANTYLYGSDIIGYMEDLTLAGAQAYIPADYSGIVPVTTPYFAPESKFYLFNAKDMYGDVILKIFYGGYVNVLPIQAETTSQPEAEVTADTPVPTAAPTDDPSDKPESSEEPTSTPEIFTFDMTELLNQNSSDTETPSSEPTNSAQSLK